jgi:signal recognition particle subunit SEC65
VENPTIHEIAEILSYFRLPHTLENKVFPRDVLARGRFRVMLKHPTGSAINPDITSSKCQVEKSLLVKLSELIPRLKSRLVGEEVKEVVPGKKKKKGRR